MKESSTYQAILQEGRGEGRIAEVKNLILKLGTKKLGAPSGEIALKIETITDRSKLEAIHERIIDATHWDDLFGGDC